MATSNANWNKMLSGKRESSISASIIPFSFRCEIRREATASALARQGEATTYRIEMEMEVEVESA